MQDTQRARLLRLRYVMNEISKMPSARANDIGPVLQRACFDIGVVGMKQGEHYICGCVVGLASLDPVLQEEGLVGRFEYRGDIGAAYMVLRLDCVPMVFSDDRLAHFFGVSPHSYRCLVDPSAYEARGRTTPETVISRIDRLLAGEEIEADPYMTSMIQDRMISSSSISADRLDYMELNSPPVFFSAGSISYTRYESMVDRRVNRVLPTIAQRHRYETWDLQRPFVDPPLPQIERAAVRERELVDA